MCLAYLRDEASLDHMFDISVASLLGGLIFSLIGMVAFRYGKIHSYWQPMLLGAGLMVYPYMFTETWQVYGIGTALTIGLFVFRGQD